MLRISLILIVLLSILSCKQNIPLVEKKDRDVQIMMGQTMGTYYNIRVSTDNPTIKQSELDSLLQDYNNELSTYVPSSTISQLNSSTDLEIRIDKKESPHFYANYILAKEIYNRTKGHFDPTLDPIINFWGFGYDKETYAKKDTSKIKELMKLVGFRQWTEEELGDSILIITKPEGASLDFSALAKGYGVDLVCDYIESKGFENYLVDIGGEVSANGTKADSVKWVVGINKPVPDGPISESELYISVENESVATSGNYRNFYEENGEKFSHIINPYTGKSVKSNVLSITIVHKDCVYADGFATAMMVVEFGRIKRVIDTQEDTEGLVLYLDEEGHMGRWLSKGFEQRIIESE